MLQRQIDGICFGLTSDAVADIDMRCLLELIPLLALTSISRVVSRLTELISTFSRVDILERVVVVSQRKDAGTFYA